MSLQEIKHQLALEYKWNNFYEVTMFEPETPLSNIIDEVARRYAAECCKASLEKAVQNATCSPSGSLGGGHEVDKESITNPENIML